MEMQKIKNIRFIKIKDLKEEEILKAYNNRYSSPIYRLTTDLWWTIRNWEKVKSKKKINNSKEYDETVISVVLKDPCDNELNYIDIRFLLSMIYNIRNECGQVYVCFRQECRGDFSDYFRLSAFLKLWLFQNSMANDVKFFDTSDKSMYAVKRFARNFDGEDEDEAKYYTAMVSDEFFPIIEINNQSYNVLDKEYHEPSMYEKIEMANILSKLDPEKLKTDNEAIRKDKGIENDRTGKYLESYLFAYIDKTVKNLLYKDKWNKFISNYKPSILVSALLSTIIKCLIEGNKDKQKNKNNINYDLMDDNVWVTLIEHCYSYAQGILQLIDNANSHIVEENDNNGALFAFWIRNDKNNIIREDIADKDLSSCEFFLETLIADCDLANIDEVGIVSKYNNTLKEKGVSAKVNTLDEIFNYPEITATALKEYYNDTNNIAYHYGLQIFSGIIEFNKGILIVVSGKECVDVNISLSSITYCNDKKNRYKLEKPKGHFSGTAYIIVIPVILPKLESSEYNYFLGNEPIGVKLDQDLEICTISPNENYFFIKEDNPLKIYNNEQILNVDFKHITERKAIELTTKKLLVKFVEENSIKALCLTGLKNEFLMLDVMRVILLFYNKLGEFEKIKDKGIFLYCRYPSKLEQSKKNENLPDKEYEIYFNGSSINSVLQNIYRQNLVRNIPELFINEVRSALERGTNHDYAPGKSLSAAIIKYYITPQGWSESIIRKQIKDILSTDIHTKPLGCRISNTHVRIGSVHLDTFYEAQFLFGNAYCTDIFALYLADCVQRQMKKKEYKNVILYGYETYSTLTLYKAQGFLGNIASEMLVYEKANERVRYLKEEFIKEDTLIVYVMGVSSTLSTFEQMNKAFDKTCKEEGINVEEKIKNNIDNICISIIQIVGDGCDKYIEKDDENAWTYKSKKGYVNFTIDSNAHYFVTAESKWYSAEEEDCKYCLPEKTNNTVFEELPLIEVDDTSVVPTQMIFLNEDNKEKNIDDSCGRDNVREFLNNENNVEYLRYGHIERYDNHFQYFFRIASLYHDKQEDIENNWLKELPKKYKDAFDLSPNTVNILIAPQHFSNTGFVNSIAKCVFGDCAHIIELDIRKEYRSNFRTKYSNYRQLAKSLDKFEGYKLNFYYVNDQIITGKTFKRAESLINTLLEQSKLGNDKKVFKGIFTIVDRNSYATRKDYVNPIERNGDEYLPFFSYLRFDIPSLRNHDNSCPLCGQNKAALDIVDAAAFTSTVHFWQEKIVYHKQRTSDMVRELDKKRQSPEYNGKGVGEREYKRRTFRRLQCENEIWENIYKYSNSGEIYYFLLETILKRERGLIKVELDKLNEVCGQKERRIKLTRKLKELNELLAEIGQIGMFTGEEKHEISHIICDLPNNLLYDVFKIVIARLCAIGSCALLDHDRLNECCVIGNYLHSITERGLKDDEIYHYESEYGEYLISYLKIISRPLLFYREPVKKAVLKLLLSIYNQIVGIFASGFQTADNMGKKADKDFYDQKFEGFLLNSVKRLLCYDKGISKCNYCDKYAFGEKDNVLDGGFFNRLYIENNRKVRLDLERTTKELERTKLWPYSDKDEKIQHFDTSGNATEKYAYIGTRLKELCSAGNLGATKIKIAFFVADETEKSYIKIGGDNLAAPTMDEFGPTDDFCVNRRGIFFVRIGNNFKRFKDDNNDIYDSCHELNLMQDAYVILGIETYTLSLLRKILAFRKEILREVEKDFNNGTVRKTILFKIMTEALVRPEASSHNAAAHETYHKAFKNAGSTDAQYFIISSYSSLIISEYYRRLVKRSIIDNDIPVTIEQDKSGGDRIRFDINRIKREKGPENNYYFSDVKPYIDYLIKMLQRHSYSLNLIINYGQKDNCKILDLEFDKKEFIEFFKNYKILDLFPYYDQHFYVFMLLDILIKNAESHCPPKYREDKFSVVVRFEKNIQGNIDLSVENKYNKKWDEDYKGSGITLYALANMFGTINSAQEYCDPDATLYYTGLGGDKPQDEEFNFVVKLDNFIIKQE